MNKASKLTKRAISVLLTIVMVITAMPLSVIPASALYFPPELADALWWADVRNPANYWRNGQTTIGTAPYQANWVGDANLISSGNAANQANYMAHAVDHTGHIWEMATALMQEVNVNKIPTYWDNRNQNFTNGTPPIGSPGYNTNWEYNGSITGDNTVYGTFIPESTTTGLMSLIRTKLNGQSTGVANGLPWLLGQGSPSGVNDNNAANRGGLFFGNMTNRNIRYETNGIIRFIGINFGSFDSNFDPPITGLVVHQDLKAALKTELRRYANHEVAAASNAVKSSDMWADKVTSVTTPARIDQIPATLPLAKQILAAHHWENQGNLVLGTGAVFNTWEFDGMTRFDGCYFTTRERWKAGTLNRVDANLTAYKNALTAYKEKVSDRASTNIASLNRDTLLTWYKEADAAIKTLDTLSGFDQVGVNGRFGYSNWDEEIFDLLGLKRETVGKTFRTDLYAMLYDKYADAMSYFHSPYVLYPTIDDGVRYTLSEYSPAPLGSAPITSMTDPTQGGFRGRTGMQGAPGQVTSNPPASAAALADLQSLYSVSNGVRNDLERLWTEAQSDSVLMSIWNTLEMTFGVVGTSRSLQNVWLEDLDLVIKVWKLYLFKWEVQKILDESVDHSEGVVYSNDVPSNVYEDSDYKYSYAQVQAWRDVLAYDIDVANAMASHYDPGFAALAQDILINSGLVPLAITRRDALNLELKYRQGTGYGEKDWMLYRDWFNQLFFDTDFSKWTSKQIIDKLHSTDYRNKDNNPPIKPPWVGVLKNKGEYASMYTTAVGQMGSTMADLLYGNFGTLVVDNVIDRMYDQLATNFTNDVNFAYNNSHQPTTPPNVPGNGWIVIAVPASTNPAYGAQTVYFSWEGFGKVFRAFNAGADVRKALIDDGQYWRVNGTTQGYYDYINGPLKAAYMLFLNDPRKYYPVTNPPPAQRDADLTGTGRFTEGYTDIITAPNPHNFVDKWKAPDGFNTDPLEDAAMLELVDRLDFVLGSHGDIRPLIEMVGFQDTLTGLGVKWDDKVNLSSALQDIIENMLYTDDIINMVVGMLFPMIVDQLEPIWRDMVMTLQKMVDDNVPLGLAQIDLKLTLHQLLNLTGLGIYPDLLGNAIDPNPSDPDLKFTAARATLASAPSQSNPIPNPANNASVLASDDPVTNFTMRTGYPTHAWSPEVSRGIYDQSGKLSIPWLIEKDENGAPRDSALRKKRFEAALSTVFYSAYPLLRALLLNQDAALVIPTMATASALGGGGRVEATLKVAGIPGYASILTPIFEALLGEDTDSIPPAGNKNNSPAVTGSLAAVPATRAGCSTMVKYILDPVYAFLDNVKDKPFTTVLKLIPNLCYALSLDRIVPLLDNLEIDIGLGIDVKYPAIGGLINGLIGGMLDDAIPKMKIGDMLGGVDLSMLSDLESLIGMVTGLLGDSLNITLPSFNPGRISTYSDPNGIRSSNATGTAYISTKRKSNIPALAIRHYIEADVGAVMHMLLEWVLGSDLIGGLLDGLLGGIGIDPAILFSGTPCEQVAAIAELILPRKYPPAPVVYGVPDTSAVVPYPPWWDGIFNQGGLKAELDGKYIVDNADVLLNVLWQALTGESLDDGIHGLIAPMFTGGLMFTLVDMIQGLIEQLLDMPLFGSFDLVGMIEMLVRIDGKQLELSDFFNFPLAFGHESEKPEKPVRGDYATVALYNDAVAQYEDDLLDFRKLYSRPLKGETWKTMAQYESEVKAYYLGKVSSVDDFFDETIKYLAPLNLLLGFLLDEKKLELINLGDDRGLLQVWGGNGFEWGLQHLIGAITRPLGITGSTVPKPVATDYTAGATSAAFIAANNAWQTALASNPAAKPPIASDYTGGVASPAFINDTGVWERRNSSLGKVLYPLADALDALIANPINSLLSALPNIIYYFTDTAGPGSSLLQQSLNGLLHPLFVLLDTLRPIADAVPLLSGLLSDMDLPDGIELFQPGKDPLWLDVDVLLGGLLEGLEISGMTINLDLKKFMVPGLALTDGGDPDKAYLSANTQAKVGILFSLLDQVGLLDMIYDMGMVGVTKLIQYGKFDPPANIDYTLYGTGIPKASPIDRSGDWAKWVSSSDIPGWFRPSHAQYLAENVDTVINWAWATLINMDAPNPDFDPEEPEDDILNPKYLGQPIKEMVQGLLDGFLEGVKVGDSLSDTIDTIWNAKDIKSQFVNLMGMLAGVKGMLDGLLVGFSEIPDLGLLLGDMLKIDLGSVNEPISIFDLLAKLIFIYDGDNVASFKEAWKLSAEGQAYLAANSPTPQEFDLAADKIAADRFTYFNQVKEQLKDAWKISAAPGAGVDRKLALETQAAIDLETAGTLLTVGNANIPAGWTTGQVNTYNAKLIADEIAGPFDLEAEAATKAALKAKYMAFWITDNEDAFWELYQEENEGATKDSVYDAALEAAAEEATDLLIAQCAGSNFMNQVVPLDINWMLQPIVDFMDPAKAAQQKAILDGIVDEASFMDALAGLLGRFLPVLRVFLADSNLLLIRDLRIKPNNDDDPYPPSPYPPAKNPEGIPGTNDVPDDYAFLRVYGYNGYEKALVPIFMGIGAALPGFLSEDVLMPYTQFRASSAEDQLKAVFKPILALLHILADNPIQTLLKVLPNLAYFLSDDGVDAELGHKSLIMQAIDKLLHPLTVLLAQLGPTPYMEDPIMERPVAPVNPDVAPVPPAPLPPAPVEGDYKYDPPSTPPNLNPAYPKNFNDAKKAWDKLSDKYDKDYAAYEEKLAEFNTWKGSPAYATDMAKYNAALTKYNTDIIPYLEWVDDLPAKYKDVVYPGGKSINDNYQDELVNFKAGALGGIAGLLDGLIDGLLGEDDRGLGDFLSNMLGEMLVPMLVDAGLVPEDFVFSLDDLIVGDIVNIKTLVGRDGAPDLTRLTYLDSLGLQPADGGVGVNFVDVDLAGLLTNLLNDYGVLKLIDDMGFSGLVELFNIWDRKPLSGGTGPIDYGLAPPPATVDMGASEWLDPAVAEFLLNNADEVVNWAWRELIMIVKEEETPVAKAIAGLLSGLLGGMPMEDYFKPTLEDTVKGLLTFDQTTLTLLAGLLGSLESMLDFDLGIDGMEDLPLLELLKQLVVFESGESLDLTGMFRFIEKYVDGAGKYAADWAAWNAIEDNPAPEPDELEVYLEDAGLSSTDAAKLVVETKDDFMKALAFLLKPLLPLLRVLLNGESIRLLNVEVTQGWDPKIDIPDDAPFQFINNEPWDEFDNLSKGFLVIDGGYGYESGLLPILMALGAGLKGDTYMKSLVPPGELSDADLIAAIIDPVVCLINALAAKPVDTLLRVLPNIAYFFGRGPSEDLPALQEALKEAEADLAQALEDLEADEDDPLLQEAAADAKKALEKAQAAVKAAANGGISLLAQAVNNLLNPIAVVIALFDGIVDLEDMLGINLANLGAMIDDLLTGALGDLGGLLGSLIVGDILEFSDLGLINGFDYGKVGINSKYKDNDDYEPGDEKDRASYVYQETLVKMLYQLLSVLLGEDGLLALNDDVKGMVGGLLKLLLNGKWHEGEETGGPDLVDYSKAPSADNGLNATTKDLQQYAGFLVDNLDGLVDWAWRELLVSLPLVEDLFNDTLLPLLNTPGLETFDKLDTSSITDMVYDILGTSLFTRTNMDTIVGLISGFVPDLVSKPLSVKDTPEDGMIDLGIDIPLTLNDILKVAIQVGGKPLDLEEMLDGFLNYGGGLEYTGTAVEKAEDFKDELAELLGPVAAVLSLLLTNGDLLGIVDPKVNDNKGLIKIAGANGYETGLLPLLMGLGAEVSYFDGTETLYFLDTLKPYSAVKDDGAALIGAILDPILFLVNALAVSPVATLLQILPNLVYFLLPGNVADAQAELRAAQALPETDAGKAAAIAAAEAKVEAAQKDPGDSLLTQALVNLLYPITSLLNDPVLLDLLLGEDGLLTDLLGDYLPEDFNPAELGSALNGILLGLVPGSMDVLGMDLNILGLLGRMVAGSVVNTEFAARNTFGTSFGNKKDLTSLGVWGAPDAWNGAKYLESNVPLLLINLLDELGVLDTVQGFEGILRALLNGDWREDDEGGPGPIDYSKAPEPLGTDDVGYPDDLTQPQVDFLVDNVDAVLDWAWAALFGNDDSKTWLSELLDGLVPGLLPVANIEDTIAGTLNNLLGSFLYTRDILDMLVGMIDDLLGGLADQPLSVKDTPEDGLIDLGIDIPLTINEILKAAIQIGGKPLDLEELLARVTAYLLAGETDDPADGEAFKDELAYLLEPLGPVLRLLLMEGDLLGIVDPKVNDNNGLIKIAGANGYETGLLPLLMGIGAEVPGFLDTLWKYEDIDTDLDLMYAILDPILFLLNALAKDPISTILTVLPNLAYFMLPGEEGGDSLLTQALINLLYPITSLLNNPDLLALLLGPGGLLTDLLGDFLPEDFDPTSLGALLSDLLLGLITSLDLDIGGMLGMEEGKGPTIVDLLYGLVVGKKALFADADIDGDLAAYLATLGINGGPNRDGGADYLAVNKADLLVSLLSTLGVFDLLRDLGDGLLPGLNLLKLLELLNYPGRLPRNFLSPIKYAPATLNKDPYYGWTWTRRDAVALLGKLPVLIDQILEMFLGGNTLNELLYGLLGDSLFTQGNFNGIVNGLQGALKGLDLSSIDIGIPGLNLAEILNRDDAITIGGEPLKVIDILDALANWPLDSWVVTDADSFLEGLVDFLAPAMPLLDFLLFGGEPGGPYNDLTVLNIKVNKKGVNDEEYNGLTDYGVIVAYGYEGYKYGLIPILEALLMPLGRESKIVDAETLRGMADNKAKLGAMLMPLLAAVDEVVADPLAGLLKLLPSIAYFVDAVNSNGKTALDESLDNTLYAILSLLGLLTDQPASLDTLWVLLGYPNGLIDLIFPDKNIKLNGRGWVGALLDQLLFDLTSDENGQNGIPYLGSSLLKNLIVGTPINYKSAVSGGAAVFLGLVTVEDQADLLTAVLRFLIEAFNGWGAESKANREAIVNMVTNMIIPKGDFGNTALHWGIHFVMFMVRLCGTELTLEKLQWLVNFVSFMMPIIKWFMAMIG